MTDTEREWIIEAGKKAAVGAPPIPDEAAKLIRETLSKRPIRLSKSDTERRIDEHAQSVADAAPPRSDDQKTAVRRAIRAGRATEYRL